MVSRCRDNKTTNNAREEGQVWIVDRGFDGVVWFDLPEGLDLYEGGAEVSGSQGFYQ